MAIRDFGSYQEAFDATMIALAEQGCLSGKDSGCFYRHPDNPSIKCAVGLWLSDEEAEHYEGLSASNVNTDLPKINGVTDPDFWVYTQFVHDYRVRNVVSRGSRHLQRLQTYYGVNTSSYNLIKDLKPYEIAQH